MMIFTFTPIYELLLEILLSSNEKVENENEQRCFEFQKGKVRELFELSVQL